MPRKPVSGGIFFPLPIGYGPPKGGSGTSVTPLPIPWINMNPQQVGGLSPLYPCTDECRQQYLSNEQLQIVFGNVALRNATQTATYENDFNTWLINLQAYAVFGFSATVTIKIQKLVKHIWTDKATLSTNSHGINYALNSITSHLTYRGYALNWGEVLRQHGAGVYRTFWTVVVKNKGNQTIASGCLRSDCFWLRQFSCRIAHGTVKYEKWITGKIGDPYVDYLQHDFCNIIWYESHRYRGFFGYPKVKEFLEEKTEWGAPTIGKQERFEDEAVQQFIGRFKLTTETHLTRFMTYGLTGIGDLRVSDYNINNATYDIKRMVVVKDSTFEPKYNDPKWQRLQGVEVLFERGVQSIMATNCCEAAHPGGG